MRQISPRTRRPGFTLIEVMVVVAIIGIMSALAVFTVNQVTESSRERGSARGVAALIKRARSLAVQEHAIVEVVGDTGADTVKLQSCPARWGTTLCVGLAAKTDVPNAIVRLNVGTESSGVELTSVPGTALIFGTNGFPLTAGAYTFKVNHPNTPGDSSIVVTAGGDVRVQ